MMDHIISNGEVLQLIYDLLGLRKYVINCVTNMHENKAN